MTPSNNADPKIGG